MQDLNFILPSGLLDLERALSKTKRRVETLEGLRKRSILRLEDERALTQNRALAKRLKRAIKAHPDALKQQKMF